MDDVIWTFWCGACRTQLAVGKLPLLVHSCACGSTWIEGAGTAP